MSAAAAVRRAVLAVFVGGIAGMIVSSIRDATGAALSFGLVTAAGALCLFVATAVAGGGAPPDPEAQAARVELLVGEVVAAGADEAQVRRLVGEAVKLGKALVSPGPDA
jgi:hypothetical protein